MNRRSRPAPPVNSISTMALILVVSLGLVTPASAVAAPAGDAEPRHREGHAMVVAGVVLVVTSVLGYVGLAAGLGVGNQADADVRALRGPDDLSERRDAQRRGRIANAVAIGSGVSAAVMMGIGIPLIAVGRRRATADASRASLHLRPSAQGMGAALRLRF